MSILPRVVAVVIAAAGIALTASDRAAPAFPWLVGFAPAAVGTERSSDAADRLGAWLELADRCSTWDAREITADVAPSPGRETVLASIATGVIVLDADGRRLASAPLAECGGSADGIVALAAGDAWIGAPVIAVVFSDGGHRRSETALSLFRYEHGRLVTVFTGELELRDGADLWSGSATLLPGAIFYRPPIGPTTVHALERVPPADAAR